jgi:hypothetical protein
MCLYHHPRNFLHDFDHEMRTRIFSERLTAAWPNGKALLSGKSLAKTVGSSPIAVDFVFWFSLQ